MTVTKPDLEPGWRAGVRIGKKKTNLPTKVAVEMNLLGVPTYVLNAKVSKSIQQIDYSWKLKDDSVAKNNLKLCLVDGH